MFAIGLCVICSYKLVMLSNPWRKFALVISWITAIMAGISAFAMPFIFMRELFGENFQIDPIIFFSIFFYAIGICVLHAWFIKMLSSDHICQLFGKQVTLS